MQLSYCDLCDTVLKAPCYVLSVAEVTINKKGKQVVTIKTKEICERCKNIIDYILVHRKVGMQCILTELEQIWNLPTKEPNKEKNVKKKRGK